MLQDGMAWYDAPTPEELDELTPQRVSDDIDDSDTDPGFLDGMMTAGEAILLNTVVTAPGEELACPWGQVIADQPCDGTTCAVCHAAAAVRRETAREASRYRRR